MKILTIPNPILTTKAEEVTDFIGIKTLGEEMITTAKNANLVGLAANQVGILQRIFVMNMTPILEDGQESLWKIFVNPSYKPIVFKNKQWEWEGCGSIPRREGLVERWREIRISAYNELGEKTETILYDFVAITYQHESDHLNGILLTSPAKARQWRNKK